MRFCLWSDIGFRNLLLVFAVKVMVLLVNWLKMEQFYPHIIHSHPDTTHHPGSEAHEQVLEVSPGRGAHRLLLGAGELRQAVDEGPVTLAQLVGAQAALALPGADLIFKMRIEFLSRGVLPQ